MTQQTIHEWQCDNCRKKLQAEEGFGTGNTGSWIHVEMAPGDISHTFMGHYDFCSTECAVKFLEKIREDGLKSAVNNNGLQCTDPEPDECCWNCMNFDMDGGNGDKGSLFRYCTAHGEFRAGGYCCDDFVDRRDRTTVKCRHCGVELLESITPEAPVGFCAECWNEITGALL